MTRLDRLVVDNPDFVANAIENYIQTMDKQCESDDRDCNHCSLHLKSGEYMCTLTIYNIADYMKEEI